MSRKGASPSRAWKLLPLVVPVAAVVWYLTLGEAARAELVERVPGGAGGRARNAGLAFAALVGLAWLGLPFAYHGGRGAGRLARRCASASGAVRVLLLPLQGLAAVVSGLFGALFVTVALAVIAAALLTLLATAWIVRPELLGGQEAVVEWVESWWPRHADGPDPPEGNPSWRAARGSERHHPPARTTYPSGSAGTAGRVHWSGPRSGDP